MIASGIVPRAIAGRMRWRIASHSAAQLAEMIESTMNRLVRRSRSVCTSSRPMLGSQPSFTAKVHLRISARKKIGHADADQRPDEADVVERPAGVLGGDDAERDADDDGEQHRREGELEVAGKRSRSSSVTGAASRCSARSRRAGDPLEVLARTARRAAGRGRTGARSRRPPPGSPVRRAAPAPVRRAAPASTAKTRNETAESTGMANRSRRAA